MNIDAALLMIDMCCEHRHALCIKNTRKLLLVGIGQVADVCIAAIQTSEQPEKWAHSRREIQLVKNLAEEGLASDRLERAFFQIQGVSLRAVPSPI